MGGFILEIILNESRYHRQIREKEWIDRLRTETPDGLNKIIRRFVEVL